jgi:hypothetical protein
MVGVEVVGVGKLRRPLSKSGWCGPARSARGSDRETDTRGPRGFFIIPKLFKLAQIKKSK